MVTATSAGTASVNGSNQMFFLPFFLLTRLPHGGRWFCGFVSVVTFLLLTYYYSPWNSDIAIALGVPNVRWKGKGSEPDTVLIPESLFPSNITEGLHVSPPLATGSCSCWNITSKCCERGVHPNHKFGTFLIDELFGPPKSSTNSGHMFYKNNYNDRAVSTSRLYRPFSTYFDLKKRGKDYREVFVTRNWFDAIVSGYLYHKSGRECWLDTDGSPKVHPLPNNLSAPLLHPTKTTQTKTLGHLSSYIEMPPPWPAMKGRNVCQYLADESETAGLRYYSAWAVNLYYLKTLRVFKAVQEYEDCKHRRTLFVCYEDLNDPVTRNRTVENIQNWLYPANNNTIFISTQSPSSRTGGHHGKEMVEAYHQEEYRGGHATSHDPALRNRLKSIIEMLDEQVFHGEIRRSSQLFGCG